MIRQQRPGLTFVKEFLIFSKIRLLFFLTASPTRNLDCRGPGPQTQINYISCNSHLWMLLKGLVKCFCIRQLGEKKKPLAVYHIEIQISVLEGALHRLNPNIPTGEFKQMQFVPVLVCVSINSQLDTSRICTNSNRTAIT